MTSVLSSDRHDARGSLVVGTTQATLQRDSACRVYMVLSHHSPDLWHDCDAVTDVMRHRAPLFLCGHKHAQRIERVEDMLRVTAGAVHPEPGKDWEPRYNWLVIDVTDSDPAKLVVRVWPRVFRRGDNVFTAEFNNGREYREDFFELPPCELAGDESEVATLSADGPANPPDEEPSNEEPLPEDAVRPPLLASTGDPDRGRDVVGHFLNLTYPQQMQVLQELGLLADEDRDRRFVEIARIAVGRARERGLMDQLDAAVRRAETNGNAGEES